MTLNRAHRNHKKYLVTNYIRNGGGG